MLALVSVLSSAHAESLEGIDLAPATELTGHTLVLNGAGVRKILVVKVYVAALYLPQKSSDGEAIIRAGQASRLEMHLLRDLTSTQLADSITKALLQTLTDAERAPLDAQIQELDAALKALPPLKKGEVFSIDYVPGTGTTLMLDGESKGVRPGADFNAALLRIWLGSRARDPKLRDALLGSRSP
jgi:hypothetical protein